MTGCTRKAGPPVDFASNRIQGVRFDPSYYYNLKQPLKTFVDSAVSAWQAHGINTVFFKAYDPEYGAVYKTHYRGNAMTDYGNKDLLGLFLDACHRRGVRVMAWLPVFEHKGAWDAHPEWRIKAADGSDLQPLAGHHFLCVRQPGFVEWWKGFLKDMLDRHPDLDGVDFSEPAIVWKQGTTCACDRCRKEILAGGRASNSPEAVAERAKGLTDVLLASSRVVKDAGRTACVTFIATTAPSSDLLPFAKQKDLTGLDVDGLLDSPDKPQWLSVELMWQQWADLYDNPATFRPDWTRKAVEQSLAQVGTRAHVLAHVEITPLGPVEVSPNELVASIIAARRGGAQSIEFYDTHLADSLGAWGTLEKAWNTQSERRAIVLHDPKGEGVAKQVAVLFGHFGLGTEVVPVDSFADTLVKANDLLIYVGNKENYALPTKFLDYARRPNVKIFWCDFNLWQLDRPYVGGHGDTNTYKDSLVNGVPLQPPPSLGVFDRLGIKFQWIHKSPDYNTVLYRGQELFKTDSVLNKVRILDSNKVKVYAWVKSKDGEMSPYILRSGNFWFVADCPTDYIVEGGRDIAFADMLHDFVGETHPDKHTALVRIEDVCPLTDPHSIRAIADLLHREGVPFAISLVPYYVDPEENIAVSMSDKPEFVKALHYAVGKGAAIAMHGSTHQYRGRSTYDYEFWDKIHDSPIFEDSKEYVRVRLQRGIDEMRKNDLYPIVFETPHYACSQLDYGVIDQYFSDEYGRRQVIDKTGFDQLVPYFIARHPSGNSIIPENLGYVPNDRQDAAPLLRFAQNNLAVRDGFASFFFHPWIDRKVLKDLIHGIRGMGYTFSDIRNVPLRMSAPGILQVTGSQNVTLKPEGKFLRTFFLDETGTKRKEWISDGPVTREFTQSVECPPGWTFVAETVDGKPKWYRNISWPGFNFLNSARERLLESPPLRFAQGRAARPGLLWVPEDSAAPSRADAGAPAAKPRFPASQEAWARALSACGLDFDTLRVDRFLAVPEVNNLVVVPAMAAPRLSTSQALILSQWVAKGNDVIVEGPSQLAEQLGIRATDSSKTVQSLKDDYLPAVDVKWPKPAPLYDFDADVQYVNQYSNAKDEPVVAGGEYGEGKYLFFAAPFAEEASATAGMDASAPYRFPFFLDMVQRQFNLFPVLRAPSLEIYFDPGSREDVPVEQLVANWKKTGVRAVYIAGWHDYVKYTFEYGYMAELLHKAGILGYAWFDLPDISDRFWQEHPAWREKTAAGTDAEMDSDIGWKQYMNLVNDTCRAGAYNSLKRMLLLAPWDGVVLTGRMFAGDNPDSAKHITPFNASFRAQYQRDKGYDPARIFEVTSPQSYRKNRRYWDEFLAYRDSVEQALTADVIGFLEMQRPLQRQGAEIVLSRPLGQPSEQADSLYHRLLEKDPMVRLQAAGVAPLVDAASLGRDIETWRAAYPKWKPMAEINFDRQKPASRSTSQLCGLELMELLAAAEKNGVRVTLRTEDHIFDTDLRNLAFATSAAAAKKLTIYAHGNGEAWDVNAPVRTVMDLDEGANAEVLVDGNIWPAYEKGRLLLPLGNHRIEGCPRLYSWRALLSAPARIAGFNGGISEARNTLLGLAFKYDSPQPAALSLSQRPMEISLDGLPLALPGAGAQNAGAASAKSSGSEEPLSLPAGIHLVNIVTRPLATSIMRQASIGLSVLIIIISSLTVLAFGLLYAGGWLKRLYAGDGKDNAK